jgi:FkbM family methyltransferase
MLRRINDILQLFRPANTHSQYRGFTVYHHKHDSLMRRVRYSHNGTYEEDEAELIADVLKKSTSPVMLDIGANIGLMSLNVCAAVKNVRIFAFEPGPNQFEYLKANVEGNALTGNVSIFNVALGTRKGETDFFIHEAKDSSGDGIVDTGRAGKGRTIKVPAQTLDGWWNDHGAPAVDLIKIDTEGFELPILRHATALIDKCRPWILTEICYLNFEKYGLTFEEHIQFFDDRRYVLLDVKTKARITKRPLADVDQFYYLAIPENEYESI